MSEHNKAIVRRYLEEVFAQGDLDGIQQLFAPDYVEHDPASDEEIRGHEGVRRDLSIYQSALSDIEIAVEDQIVEGDRVATRATLRNARRGAPRGASDRQPRDGHRDRDSAGVGRQAR